MLQHLIRALATLSALALLLGCATPPAASSAHSPTGLGSPKNDGGIFQSKHAAFLRRAQEGPVDLLFIGDSITEGWAHRAPALWQQQYGRYHPANFGIGGDRVEHLLWRLDNGELEHIRPRVIVLLIGTNNSASQTAPQITAGIRQILDLIASRQPQSKVLLLAVFPRGPRKAPDGRFEDNAQRMQVIHAVNAALARFDDGQRVRFLDIGAHFLRDGQIPPELMPDQLHPSLAGYRIWAEAMQPLLGDMLAQP
ncbi:MAG: family lipase [Proteobacteria bacterium]|nr:family lipase [Pseudomonadota bacterium]